MISLRMNDKIFIKDPESTDLGKFIIRGSVELIEDLGYENFTFKKLAKHIGSTEASIYRYFSSKHKILIYLCSWYWSWMEYKITFAINNIKSAEMRLEISLKLLTEVPEQDAMFQHIDEQKLFSIVIEESSKSFLSKQVDEDNVEGYFLPYKSLVDMVSNIILEINQDYEYPHMLVSSVIEGAHLQRFFAEHLPRLTDETEDKEAITCFFTNIAKNAIKK